MLLWIALLLSFFSLSYVHVRAEKRTQVLLSRISILETALVLGEREIKDLKKDVDVLLSTETLSSTVEEGMRDLESQVSRLEEIVGTPRDASDSICDQLDHLTELAEIECVRVEDLDGDVRAIIEGIPFKISIERGR